jgi:L-alanine-DL-glutamate epimerase-like enolase superfamily enzyme
MESPVNGGPPVARLSRFGEGLSDDPLEFKDGYIILPNKPGLGMDMNEDALRANAYQHFPQRRIRQYSDEP